MIKLHQTKPEGSQNIWAVTIKFNNT